MGRVFRNDTSSRENSSGANAGIDCTLANRPSSFSEVSAGRLPGGDAAIEVKLCDDETTVQIAADTPKTRAEGQKIADALMSQWQQKHPDQDWIAREQKHPSPV